MTSFTVSPPPHRKKKIFTRNLMWNKIIALLPISIAAFYFFGLAALVNIIAAILGAVGIEFIIQKAFNKKLTIMDGSAIYIGLLLALIAPPSLPAWMIFIAGAFAVGIGKLAFGGIGSYIFHPALAAWVFLSLAWSQSMLPGTVPITSSFSDLILERGAGFLTDVSPILVLLPGIALILMKNMEWRVPLAYFLTTVILALVLGDPLSYVVTGTFLLGVLFIATDTVTSPVTRNGRIIYGILCGFLTVLYGYFSGNYVWGTLYALLLANAVAPYIELKTLPKPMGGVVSE